MEKMLQKINRATLGGCKIINHSNMEKLVDDYYRDNYLSRNKLENSLSLVVINPKFKLRQ